ncbi:MAG: DsbA oxidoreductase [uncultured bacterium]|nr:MAG: DsbA oxidoreductase [uncultured bacterium]
MKRSLLLGLIVVPFLFSCKPQGAVNAPSATPAKEAAKEVATEAPKTADTSAVLAKINGIDVTDEEVTALVKKRLQKVESQIFDIKRDGLDEIIEEKLIVAEAKKRGITADELMKKELTVEEPSEQEITTFYSMYKDRFKGKPLDEVKPQLLAQLRSTKARALHEQFIDKLKKEASIEINMERPRIEVSVDDDPSQGPKDAPITLVEFSEFQCPYCNKARSVVAKIMETYKGKVHYVFRDFPLSFHKMATKAAEAANCANDQGKYWPYNANLFEHQSELGVDKLKEYAKTQGLNTKKFDECLDSGKYTAEIEKDINEGAAAGVTGTPAYFINGVFISGAQPFENFKSIIDEELTRLKVK